MKWIDDIVVGLVETYETNNPYELCDALGIEIRKLSPDNILLRGHEGFYHRYYDGKEIIFISNKLKRNFEKFVLSHELGHAVCNAEISVAGFMLTNTGKTEKQANYFALKLQDLDISCIEFEGFTYEQVASSLNLPSKCLKDLVKF